MRSQGLCLAVLLGVALTSVPADQEIRLVQAETVAGGGALSGGGFRMFSSITVVEPAGPITGDQFELTAGLERRRDRLPDGLFGDGFEGG